MVPSLLSLGNSSHAGRANSISRCKPTEPIFKLFLGEVQMRMPGLIGEYLAHVYDEVKGRPRRIVNTALGFPGDQRKGDASLSRLEAVSIDALQIF